MRPARARIDLGAMRHNLQQARKHAQGARVMAVIKANGYGHGILRAARGLAAADGFAVASLEEALQLREAGIDKKILLLEGFFEPDELDTIAARQLDLVIHQPQQLALLEQTRLAAPVGVWLKINTGMNRLGVAPEQAVPFYQRLVDHPDVSSVTLMTHFANADDRRDSYTRQQSARFYQCIDGLDAAVSCANSAALLFASGTLGQWVRPGIMLYGVSPFLASTGRDEDLKPVMTLESELIAVRQQRAGDPVGYGGAWVCPEDMPVGVVAIGYGDGYPRHAKTGTPVLVRGQRASLIGRVSMDMLTLDLRNVIDAQIGDRVVLWGDGLAVEEVAGCSGTIAYELLCQVTDRVRFLVEQD